MVFEKVMESFKTPILLLTFNRPNHVRRVLTEILKQEPPSLYVCQDGAREGNESDHIKCQEVREVIYELTSAHAVSHEHFTLHTLYQPTNLGCGPGPAAGISWFFENVEQGIVIEDDCLPHPDFFRYCTELLDRYKNNLQIQFISATLYHDRWKCNASYGFSHYMVTGAWAAWRRSWDGFDLDLHRLNARVFRSRVHKLTGSRTEADWWYFKLIDIQRDNEKKSYWDYQMQIRLFSHEALTIHPKINLISNIGFDEEGTHTWTNNGMGDRPVYPILPLSHPGDIRVIDNAMDVDCFGKTSPQTTWQWIKSRIYREMLYSKGLLHVFLLKYKSLKHGK